MYEQPASDSGEDANALASLRTAIASLHASLEALPETSDEGFYALLAAAVEARLPPVYAAYDAYLAAVLITEGRRVTCLKGCSACCRHFVSSVEPFELVALDRALKSRPEYADQVVANYRRAKTYEEIIKAEGLDDEAEDRALYRYFLRGHACTFLNKDGTCGVYEWRPMSCRMFYAESSPRFCAGKELASPWNKNFQVELPLEAEEALARCSRLLEGLGLSENLFPGLVEVNALFGRFDGKPPEVQPENPKAPPSPPRVSASGSLPPTPSP